MFYEFRSLLRLKHCVSLREWGTGCTVCPNLFISGARSNLEAGLRWNRSVGRASKNNSRMRKLNPLLIILYDGTVDYNIGMGIDRILTIPVPYQFLLIDSIPYRFSYRFLLGRGGRAQTGLFTLIFFNIIFYNAVVHTIYSIKYTYIFFYMTLNIYITIELQIKLTFFCRR